MLMLLPAVAQTPWERFTGIAMLVGILVVLWGLPFVLSIRVGNAKGRGAESVLLPIFLGWLGFFIVAMLPQRETAAQKRRKAEQHAESHKTCPDCAEEVKVAARKCKHCGYEWPE